MVTIKINGQERKVNGISFEVQLIEPLNLGQITQELNRLTFYHADGDLEFYFGLRYGEIVIVEIMGVEFRCSDIYCDYPESNLVTMKTHFNFISAIKLLRKDSDTKIKID